MTGATLNLDAKGAFDRIIQALALLAICHLGMTVKVVLRLGQTWNSTVHCVQTGHGIS